MQRSAEKRVTIAFVPREQFATTQRCLELLLQRTSEPDELIVVDGGSPPGVQQYLQSAAMEHGFRLLRTDEYLTPNQARNLALAHVETPYVAFVDNDVLVSEGWLTALVDCAERSGAWVVGPLYFEFEPERRRIHMFGGEVGIQADGRGRMTCVEKHLFAHELLSDVQTEFHAQPTDLIEFHTVLIRMGVFQQIGRLDEGFQSTSEHVDLCLEVRQAGGEIWIEPASQITYAPPKSLSDSDREFFLLRWSEARGIATLRHMVDKYQLHPRSRGVRLSARWLAGHRRYSMDWLPRWKRRLGVKLGSRLEKSVVTPLEKLWNRWHYPLSRYGSLSTPRVSVFSPTSGNCRRCAA